MAVPARCQQELASGRFGGRLPDVIAYPLSRVASYFAVSIDQAGLGNRNPNQSTANAARARAFSRESETGPRGLVGVLKASHEILFLSDNGGTPGAVRIGLMGQHGEHWAGQMSRKLRGAVFGCGMISEHHLRAWNRIPEAEIVALGSRTAERAEQRRREFAPAARVYDDLRLMLDQEDLDFVDILTAPSVHREHCLIAKEAGVHIICQKPLCNTLGEAKRLACEMRGYPHLFVVHENHRYRPWFQRIDSEYRSGGFGRVSFVRLEHLNAREPAEAYKLAAAEGVLLEYGSHLVDMMRRLLGEPLRVYARAHEANPAVKAESLVHAVYEYPHTTAVIDVAWKHAAITQGSVLVVGSVGEAYFEGTMTRGETSRLRLWRNGIITRDEHRSVMEDYGDSFYQFQRESVDAMLGVPGRAARTVEDYLPTLVCTFAAYESADRGAIVEIPREAT